MLLIWYWAESWLFLALLCERHIDLSVHPLSCRGMQVTPPADGGWDPGEDPQENREKASWPALLKPELWCSAGVSALFQAVSHPIVVPWVTPHKSAVTPWWTIVFIFTYLLSFYLEVKPDKNTPYRLCGSYVCRVILPSFPGSLSWIQGSFIDGYACKYLKDLEFISSLPL